MKDATPQVYLSTSDNSWRVIFQGMPLCADTTLERAQHVAIRYGYNPGALPVWDGDAGRFSVYSAADWQSFAS
jgi:hypothetical protein